MKYFFCKHCKRWFRTYDQTVVRCVFCGNDILSNDNYSFY